VLESEENGRRFTRWVLTQRLEENLTPTIMTKFRNTINTAFYIRYLFAAILENIEDGREMVFYTRKRGSPW